MQKQRNTYFTTAQPPTHYRSPLHECGPRTAQFVLAAAVQKRIRGVGNLLSRSSRIVVGVR